MNEPTHFESLYPAESRFGELERILTFIKEGNSCQVVSMPGCGRANLFGFLSYNRAIRERHLGDNQKWFHFVTVSLSEVQKRPLRDVTKFLFLALADSLRERKIEEYKKVNAILKETLGLDDELVLFQGLKRAVDYLALEKELTVVFLIDRFETYIPMLTPQFFTNLRALRNRAKYRFSVVFALNRALEDVLEPALFADFSEFLTGHTIYLALTDRPSIEFRISYIEKATGRKLSDELKKKLFELTSGHAKLTRLSVEIVLALDNRHSGEAASGGRLQNRFWTSQNDMEENLQDFLLSQKPIQNAMHEVWNSLNPAEQTHITKQLFQKEYEDEHTEFLNHIGLVKNGRITILLFEQFTKKLLASSVQRSVQIRYNEGTNDIVKGDSVLSDKLTATEFKLLRYLLENPDKILDRESVIQTVWSDTKSTAGVTDQALDQLIFRLRKKIEDDPNNPRHIQTVKGRGFRFVP